jgi:hypothetical protein
MWLRTRVRRQSDPIARPNVVGVPSATPAAIRFEDTILAVGVELRIGAVQVCHGDAVLACDIPQRVAAFDRHSAGIVIGRASVASAAPIASGLQMPVK